MARILVIDDDRAICETLAAGLRPFGHAVLTASNGSSGFMQAVWRKVDAILLDIGLPDIVGLDLLVKLKTDERTRHIPVVMLTGYDVDEYRDMARFGYAEFYVLKTAGMSEIGTRLNQAIAASVPAPGEAACISHLLASEVCQS